MSRLCATRRGDSLRGASLAFSLYIDYPQKEKEYLGSEPREQTRSRPLYQASHYLQDD